MAEQKVEDQQKQEKEVGPNGKGDSLNIAEIPERYRQFVFVNAGGPSRKVIAKAKAVIQKKWQLVTLDCSHRILLPKYQKSAKVGCGFCGGFDPLSENDAYAAKMLGFCQNQCHKVNIR